MAPKVIVCSGAEQVARAALELIAEFVDEADGGVTLGLAGGSTPRATYRLLRGMDLPWQDVLCWLSDERWVPPDHADSNVRMVQEELISHVPVSFLGPDTSFADPHLAAAAYQALLLPALLHHGELSPDLILLGMGDDGHTASLFPETNALAATRPGFVANWVPQAEAWRLTATLPLLTAARRVIFLVTGGGKAEAVRRVLTQGAPLPAGLVGSGAAEAYWLLDEPAAAFTDVAD